LQKSKHISLFLVALLGIGISSATIYISKPTLINIFSQTKKEAPGLKWERDTVIHIYPFHVDGEMTFAGERVPLEEADVRERLDREIQINVLRQSNTILNMKLANRFFPEIERILAEEGVPADFKYLPLIESDLRDVVSPAGAGGFWQFVPATAKIYGLEVNDIVDERYNVDKCTRAACAYLKNAKERLGSWTAAAAAYNFGTDGIAGKLDAQHTTNYYDLSIASETSRYVFRMLAMKAIFADPERAGYHLQTEDLYQPLPYTVLEVDTPITKLADFADAHGLKYKELKVLNPWMRNTSLPNKNKKVYQIRLLSK